MNKQKITIILIAIFMVLGAYASWYSFNRNQIITHNKGCDMSGNPCPLDMVPRTIWEVITDRPSSVLPGYIPARFGPMNDVPIPCGQRATTTPCIQNETKPPTPRDVSIQKLTYTLGNFTFDYPSDAQIDTIEKTNNINSVILTKNDKANSDNPVVISLAPSGFVAFNPKAKMLEDYKAGYPIGDYFELELFTDKGTTKERTRWEVVIHNQKELVINGIMMLEQEYSKGYKKTDDKGEAVFQSTDETGINHGFRYVFFDGKEFVIFGGRTSTNFINDLVQSIRIKK